MRPSLRTAVSLTAISLSLPLLAGCRVETGKNEGPNSSDGVKVATPFGHMQVKTQHADVQNNLGISVYPGAVQEKQSNGSESQADINFSFGRFKLRVNAMSYLTPDPVDQVAAFYRKDLQRYGTVITCSGHHPVGEPTHTPEGLTCEEDHDDHGAHANVSSDLELKTGSKQHQHVVGLERKGDQTKIGLVALDLPGDHFGSSAGDGKDSDEDRQ